MTTQSIHKLKTWPIMYQAMLDGSKPFDVRRDDRGFKEGDIADMREFEYNKQIYTGRAAEYLITYVLRGKDHPHLGVGLDFCVLGITPLDLDGVGAIGVERKRQISDEKFTAARDDKLRYGELATLAALYAMPYRQRKIEMGDGVYDLVDGMWPGALAKNYWKPATDDRVNSRIRELEKAGALIAAEIDRLQRTKK